MPLDDRSFSLDIAFPEKKIGIEVNGNQHYERNGERGTKAILSK